MTSTATVALDQREIVLAAERLFAKRGDEGVAVRDGAAGGSGNNSAVQYDFGSKGTARRRETSRTAPPRSMTDVPS